MHMPHFMGSALVQRAHPYPETNNVNLMINATLPPSDSVPLLAWDMRPVRADMWMAKSGHPHKCTSTGSRVSAGQLC